MGFIGNAVRDLVSICSKRGYTWITLKVFRLVLIGLKELFHFFLYGSDKINLSVL